MNDIIMTHGDERSGKYRSLLSAMLISAITDANNYVRSRKLKDLPLMSDMVSDGSPYYYRSAFTYLFPDEYGFEECHSDYPLSAKNALSLLDLDKRDLKEVIFKPDISDVVIRKGVKDGGTDVTIIATHKDGDIHAYPSMKAAAAGTGLKIWHVRYSLDNNGYQHKSGWKFSIETSRVIIRNKHMGSKEIIATKKDGSTVVYNSITEAARSLCIGKSRIDDALLHGVDIDGISFKVIGNKKVNSGRKPKKVIAEHLDGRKLLFDSVRDASKELSIKIHKVRNNATTGHRTLCGWTFERVEK